jgi:hypothetical protein
MRKKPIELALELDCFDDILDGFERARSRLYRHLGECDDLEDKQLLLQSYQNIVDLQAAIMDMVIIDVIGEKSDEN